jgi:hypothetical protein
MVIGAVAVVFFAESFIGPFQGFLITLGVRSPPGAASSWPTWRCAGPTTPSATCSTRAAATAACSPCRCCC